jgi:hypothetical protein
MKGMFEQLSRCYSPWGVKSGACPLRSTMGWITRFSRCMASCSAVLPTAVEGDVTDGMSLRSIDRQVSDAVCVAWPAVAEGEQPLGWIGTGSCSWPR